MITDDSHVFSVLIGRPSASPSMASTAFDDTYRQAHEVYQRQFDEIPFRIEALLHSQRDELSLVQNKIAELQQENASFAREASQLNAKLRSLEGSVAEAGAQLASSSALLQSEVKARSLMSESESASLRVELRQLTAKKEELEMQCHTAEKTIQRREAQLLDESTQLLSVLQGVEKQVSEEQDKSESLQRHLRQRDDCTQLIYTTRSKCVQLEGALEDYKVQLERLLRDLEHLSVVTAEEAEAQATEVKQIQAVVDQEITRCKNMERELQEQTRGMHQSALASHERLEADLLVMTETLSLAKDEIRDLGDDVESLERDRSSLLTDNQRLAHEIRFHAVTRHAEEYLREKHQSRRQLRDRQVRTRAFYNKDDQAVYLRSGGGRRSPQQLSDGEDSIEPSPQLQSSGSIEEEYLIQLRCDIAVLEKDLQRVHAEKDAIAIQVDHLSRIESQVVDVRQTEIAKLRREILAEDCRGELRGAKAENNSLKQILRERMDMDQSTIDDVQTAIDVLQATAKELREHINTATTQLVAREKQYREELELGKSLLVSSRESYQNALHIEARHLEAQKRYEAAVEENNNLQRYFNGGRAPMAITKEGDDVTPGPRGRSE